MPVFIGVLAMAPQMLAAQGAGENYIKSVTYTDSAGTSAITRVVYFDGLGRESVTVDKGMGGNGEDVVTLRQYDQLGRPWRDWSAAAMEPAEGRPSDGAVRSAAIGQYADLRPYATTEYESDPRGRVTATCAPGPWQAEGKRRRTEYLANTNTSPLNCLRFVYTSGGQGPYVRGNYAPGSLDVLKTTDEDGNTVYEFTDLCGLTLLRRQVDHRNGDAVHDTYFIYDQYHRLAMVSPPMASAVLGAAGGSENLSGREEVGKYCYLYRYDSHDRCVYRKLPGCEPVLMRYDKAGRLAFSQDGNQRADSLWTFYLSDEYGRQVVTGLHSGTPPDVAGMVVRADQWFPPGGPSGPYAGYVSNTAVDSCEILSVNYFDHYGFCHNFEQMNTQLQYQPVQGYDARYWNARLAPANGLLTGTATRVLGSDRLLCKAMYYDHHGNVVQTREHNNMGGFDHTYSRLSFTGRPLEVRREHSTADTALVDIVRYSYDGMERVTRVEMDHGGTGSWVTLAENTYDELGRTASTAMLGGTTATNYGYNIRGWLSAVTNPHFTQTLHYETTGGVPGAAACWNGNVSADVWTAPDRVGVDASLFTHRYAYGYDGLDRLTDAAYSQPLWEWDGGNVMNQSQPDYSVHCGYDLNGNITSLRRGGVTTSVNVGTTRVLDYGTVDNLSLTYDGNRLRRVGDSEDDLTYAGAMEFVNGTDQSVEYTWDANGNMTSDLNRGIADIRYNVLNLPERVTWADGHRTEHTYAADGRKLRTCHKVVDTGIATPVAGPAAAGPAAEPRGGAIGGGLIGPGIDPPVGEIPYVTVLTRDYSGGHIWRNDTLERVLTDVGFVGEDGRHRCFVNDCRGNVRAVVRHNADGTGTLEQVNSYYPGGMPMLTEVVYGDAQPYKYTGKELERQHGLNQYDFGARWYDPARPGTTTMDPLCERRPWESPYLWCAGNPVRNIDPDGRWVVGTNKKRVHFNEKTGKWSKNASSDVIRIGNAMRQTEIGKQLLHRMIASDYPIELNIDVKNLTTKFGTTESEFQLTRDRKGNEKSRRFSKSSITIYLKAIESITDDEMYAGKGFSTDEIIGAIAVHEGMHATDLESNSRTPGITKEGAERKARDEEQKFINEIIEKHKKNKYNE